MAKEVGYQATMSGVQSGTAGAISGFSIGAGMAAASAGSGAAAGAAAGATAGSWAPGIGTAIGAVIGAVVGITLGAFQGSKQKKAKRYLKQAAAVQQERERNKDYETFLQLVREQRIARASTLSQAVAGGLERSSAVSGAVSGQQSQTAHSVNYLANDIRLQELYLSYLKRAKVAGSIATDIGAAEQALDSAAITAGRLYMLSKGLPRTPAGTTTTQPTYDENYVTAAGTFTNNPVLLYNQ